jgi:hypothetical protein
MSTTHLDTNPPSTKAIKPYRGLAMEGPIARWYARIRDNDPQHEAICRQISQGVPAGGRILEVAPGPGYLAIELAKLDKFHVVGLDISKSFVEIARAKAGEAGVEVDFRHGNASECPSLPTPSTSRLCGGVQELTQPVQPSGRCTACRAAAPINDLRRDAPPKTSEHWSMAWG